MQAYRSLAKKHHPDRGGTAVEFTQLQHAFEVLSDPRQREVYDTWAKEVQFRYVRGNSSQVSYGVLMFATLTACVCLHFAESKAKLLCSVCTLTRMHLMQAAGGEDLLLDEFEGLGLHCDPQTQLVVTCEVCRRPATKECWTCGMKICEFCTLKRHWKVGLHPVGHRLANASKQ